MLVKKKIQNDFFYIFSHVLVVKPIDGVKLATNASVVLVDEPIGIFIQVEARTQVQLEIGIIGINQPDDFNLTETRFLQSVESIDWINITRR